MDGDLLSFILLSFSSLFIIVNPLGATLFFVSLTEEVSREDRATMAKEACIIAAAILLLFAIAGTYILLLFGITLEAFRIAGGILLFGIGMEMVYARPSRTKMTATEKYEGIDAESIAVMPLAIPIISGPGAIATTVVLTNEAFQYHVFSFAIVILSIILTIGITYLLLRNSEKISERIGQREYRVINRLMGILLIAIAVQFVITGISIIFPALTQG
ncbi:MAG: NAAT family transporter [Methanomicrobiaceae archaeon]|nr:NAAT family transporter [Methanomicrobiaceae archaeon]